MPGCLSAMKIYISTKVQSKSGVSRPFLVCTVAALLRAVAERYTIVAADYYYYNIKDVWPRWGACLLHFCFSEVVTELAHSVSKSHIFVEYTLGVGNVLYSKTC